MIRRRVDYHQSTNGMEGTPVCLILHGRRRRSKAPTKCWYSPVDMMAHGDEREGKKRGNWRMEWVASTLHTTSEHGLSSITTADAHTSAASSRLN